VTIEMLPNWRSSKGAAVYRPSDEWMDGWMDGWLDGWMDFIVYLQLINAFSGNVFNFSTKTFGPIRSLSVFHSLNI